MTTSSTGAHRAYEYLRQAIASARSAAELSALEELAKAHYGGFQLKQLEAEISACREVLVHTGPPQPGHRPTA